MRKLTTTVPVVFAILLAAYCVSSYLVGAQAEKQYYMLLAQASQMHSIEIKAKSFERGVFRSKAVTTVLMSGTEAEPGRKDIYEFDIVNSIQHGPLVFLRGEHERGGIRPAVAVISTQLAPSDQNSEGLRNFLNKFPELKSSSALTILSFDGSGENFFDIPPFRKELVNEKGGETVVDWGGFSSTTKFDISLDEASGYFSAPFLGIRENGEVLHINEMKGDFNSHPGVKGVSVGGMNISCASVEAASGAGKSLFRVESPGFQAETGVSEELLHGSIRARFDKLSAGEDIYGPFTFDLEGRKLEPSAFTRLQENLKNLQDQAAGKSEGALSTGFASCGKQLLIDLLAKSPELELKEVSLKTNRGDLTGRLNIAVAGPAGELTGNILFLLGNLTATADVAVSEPLLIYLIGNSFRNEAGGEKRPVPPEARAPAEEKAAGVVERLLAQNFLVREQGSLRMNLSYKSGKMTMNGRKLNILDLLKSPLPE